MTRPARAETGISAVLDDEVIPRLALAHPSESNALWVRSTASPDTFARLVLDGDGRAAGAFLDDAMRRGSDSQSVYKDLLAPAALMLVNMWRDDRLSYSEVTIGLSRLQRLVWDLPRETAYNGENDDRARCALFSPRPGEQQTFGFFMTEERFRWGGWKTAIETIATREDLVADVRRRWFDMVCVSVSRADDLPGLTEIIAAIRRASRNGDVVIAMEGAHFADHAERVSAVGADAMLSEGGDVLDVTGEGTDVRRDGLGAAHLP